MRLIMWAVLVSVGFAQAREVEEQRPLDADAEKTAAPTVSELTDASALRVPPRLPAGDAPLQSRHCGPALGAQGLGSGCSSSGC